MPGVVKYAARVSWSFRSVPIRFRSVRKIRGPCFVEFPCVKTRFVEFVYVFVQCNTRVNIVKYRILRPETRVIFRVLPG